MQRRREERIDCEREVFKEREALYPRSTAKKNKKMYIFSDTFGMLNLIYLYALGNFDTIRR